jgi:2-polyprenyl-3-methyl-5-hydroxy-6-metoxy-1,4-benzoquinol methylase
VLPVLLRAPGETALSSIADAISARSGEIVNASDIADLDLSGLAVPSIAAPSLERIFDDDVGREIIAETERLLSLLPRARLDQLGEFLSKLDIDFYKLYFKCNIIRIYHLVHLLRDLGMRSGTILEIGSLMGNFSATLQRLGYNVTAVDRYRFYQGGLDVYTEYMRSLGIHVEEMTREDEAERVAGLGQFDAVISMAVVEHIPPPVRPFLEMLASHVKPGGLLVLDTPNIAHYWNRVKLSRGESIHQDLETQYYSTPPWEGHHREYTPSELRWMLEQVGGRDIELRLFDLRMLEWEQFSSAKLQELLAMSLDPTLCVTMLAGGRIFKE